MLQLLQPVEGFIVETVDGLLGTVADFLVDDQMWIIRYLVVDLREGMSERRVLISPAVVREVDWWARCFHLVLLRDMVAHQPTLEIPGPVSLDDDLSRYIGHSIYWGDTDAWGHGDLRSIHGIHGISVLGNDMTIGRVDDVIIDTQTWAVRYLSVDTGNPWVSRHVLIAPRWASEIRWREGEIRLPLSRRTIRRSPDWRYGAPLDRAFEAQLHAYYEQAVYWAPNDGELKNSLASEAHALDVEVAAKKAEL